MCIFCKIVAGEIPSRKKYEDDEIVIFEDIEPKAKIHLLCVPKHTLPSSYRGIRRVRRRNRPSGKQSVPNDSVHRNHKP